ncbi:hypothetical protein TrVFT333_007354 [Trichoderma virens FT-333]|nr:hypothetical protein TrVFT333_007354 [Trichoderma virens FT-333]
MDFPRDMTRMELENPRLSPSPELEELFHQVFDWQAYSGDAKTSDPSSHHHLRKQSLSRIITDIPSFIRDLTLESDRDFFDMPSYSSDDGLTSDYSAGQTPRTWSRPLDDGHYHPEASLREVQAQDDEWTYPQTDSSKGMVQGYPHHLQGLDDRLRRAVDQSSKLKRRRSGNDLEKRPRQLVDPGQTADVRKSGACLPCRVSKTRWSLPNVQEGVPRPFSPGLHSRHTIHVLARNGQDPRCLVHQSQGRGATLLRPTVLHWKAPRDLGLFHPGHQPAGSARHGPGLPVAGGSEETGSLTKADFPRDCVPSHQLLQRWVENQIQTEQKSDFQQAVQSFVLAYSEEGWGLPKHDLVNKVHRMNCFFRIWKARSFWCLDPTNKLTTLPLSVQAQLRNIARRAIYSLEHDILKEMDECIAQQLPTKTQDRIAIWASMWLLILMYRELLQGFKTHIGRLASNKSESAQSIAIQGQLYKRLADSFFPLLVVFYHYQFRTKKSLELSLDWLKSPTYPAAACHSRAIREAAQQLLDSRKEHYQKLQSSKSEIDQLLCVFVVNHELKKMNARKRPSKAKGSKHAVEDDCDDDAE